MPAMQHKGYMTEAVSGLLQWVAQRDDVNTVLAEIHAANTPSIRVVEKNGFTQFDQKGDMLWYKFKV
jgi:ribosomal-protein-alanine N-acetyltransferase